MRVNPNPGGLCQCGCGRPTVIAKQTINRDGAVRGFPKRFLYGHSLQSEKAKVGKRIASKSPQRNQKIRESKLGPKNSMWKGNKVKDPNTLRARAQYRFKKIENCEICENKAIDRHHKDADLYNIEKENIQILCRHCHMKIDGRLEKLRRRNLEMPM